MLATGRIVRNRVALRLALCAAAVHFAFSLVVQFSASEGSWQWFPVFLVDLPLSLLSLTVIPSSVPPLLAFGVLGSVWWFLLAGWLTLLFCHFRRSRAGH